VSTTLLATSGILSAVVNTIGVVPYIKDIFKHKTKPERASWWIWVALGSVAFAAQLSAGSTWSLFMTGAELIEMLFIAFLSLRYGYGKFQKRDYLSLLIAICGLILWKFTDNPIYALCIVICIDALGSWLTIVKTWQAPSTETFISWLCAGLAGMLAALAVGKLNGAQLIYPLYIMMVNTFVAWIIIYRRKKLVQ
jgi:hypothetical protein